MIPDKLYVEISCNKDSSVYWIGRTSSVPQSDDSVEYIRKDALLEWARKKNKRIDTDEGDYSLGYVSAMIDLIDKLNSI